MSIENYKRKMDERLNEHMMRTALWVRGILETNYWRLKVYYKDALNTTEAAMAYTADGFENMQRNSHYEFRKMGFVRADGPWNSGGGCMILRIYFQSFALSIGDEDIIIIKRESEGEYGKACETNEGWSEYVEDYCSGAIGHPSFEEPEFKSIQWGHDGAAGSNR
jgi:hypothetical protein